MNLQTISGGIGLLSPCVIYFSLLFTSCNSDGQTIERSFLEPELICDDLESMMPGSLLLKDNYILWTDPFHSNFIVHVLDRQDGAEIAKMVEIGQGPDEFASPFISNMTGNRFLAYDTNMNKQFIYDPDSLQSGELVVSRQYRDMGRGLRYFNTIEDEYILFENTKEKPFTCFNREGTYSTGSLPFGTDIEQAFEFYQGEIIYNDKKDIFVYSTFYYPYMALYGRENGSFVLQKEKLYSKDTKTEGNKLVFNWSESGISGLALSKNYIIAHQRDYKTDPTDEQTVRGRDFDMLPQTVFLYNYDLELKKIIHLGMPILRIAAEPTSDTLYAIGVNPDFCLVKYQL